MAIFFGTSGNDTLTGTNTSDQYYAGNGNDVITTGGGIDAVNAGEGNDTINMVAGDSANGNGGADVFKISQGGNPILNNGSITIYGDYAGLDADVLDVSALVNNGWFLASNMITSTDGQQSPYVLGELGYHGSMTLTKAGFTTIRIVYNDIESFVTNTSVDGTNGNDSLSSGYTDAQGDQIDGYDGQNDTINAGDGNDTVNAGSGNDVVFGGSGDDVLAGGAGNDQLYGGDGNDLATVGGGDVALGGAGNDTFTLASGEAPTSIEILVDGGSNGAGGDALNTASNGAAQTIAIAAGGISGTINGLDGDADIDMIFVGMESITTGAGNDVVTGGGEGSAISIDTGAGTDKVVQIYNPASGSNDSYNGGAGTDTFVLAFTAETWATPAAQAEVAAYLAHLNAGNGAQPFTFTSINTTVTIFETFEITVNGVNQNPVNAGVTAGGDALAFTENGPEPLAIDLLLNDVVPDRAGSVQMLTGSNYGALSLNTSLLTTVQTANLLFVPDNAALQALREGEVVTETLTYRVTDVDGSIGDASVIITFTGTNDVATITGVATGSATEDALTPINGALTITDADTGEAAFQTPASLLGTYGSFSFNPATGDWVYTPNASAAALQSLAVSAQVTDSLTVTSVDGTATQTITVSITGENDAPTLTAAVLAAQEDGPSVTLDLASLGDDIDSDNDGTDLTYTVSGQPSVGTASISGTTLTFNGGAGLDALAVGETLTTVVTVTATDRNGGSVSNDVTVTITGTNDAPTLAAGVLGALEDGPSVTLDLASLGDDIDSDNDGTDLTYTVSGQPSVGTASINGTTLTFNGGAGLDALAVGETLTTVVTVTATDRNGATASNDVTVTITGTNDAPTLSAGVLAAAEDGPAVTLDLSALGDDIDSDNDGTDLTYTVSGQPSVGTASINGTTLTFNGGAGLDALAVGETLTTVVTVTATDRNGGSVSNDVTVTITGTNDAPTLAAGVLAAAEDGPSVTLDLSALGDDIDSDNDGTDLTYTVSGQPSVGTASINGTTLTYSFGAAFQDLAEGETATQDIEVTATDRNGATVTSVMTVTISGTNDAPVIAIQPSSTPTITDLGNGLFDVSGTLQFTDADFSDTHFLTAIDPLGVGINITSITPAQNGAVGAVTWSYVIDTDDFVVGNEETIALTANDQFGGANSVEVKFIVPGVNNTLPDVSIPINVFNIVGEGVVSVNLLDFYFDSESDPLVALGDPLQQYPGISFTGTELFFLNCDDSAYQYLIDGQTQTFTYTYLVSDGTGNAVATLEWTIQGSREGIVGTAGADDLVGDDGQSELLNGDAGDDTLTGGAGDDIFAYLNAGDGFDLITDFAQFEDRIGVSASAFGGNLQKGGAPTVLVDADYTVVDSGGTDGVFIYQTDGTDGTLYWDVDGGLGDNAVAIAQLTNVASLTQDDFFLFV